MAFVWAWAVMRAHAGFAVVCCLELVVAPCMGVEVWGVFVDARFSPCWALFGLNSTATLSHSFRRGRPPRENILATPIREVSRSRILIKISISAPPSPYRRAWSVRHNLLHLHFVSMLWAWNVYYLQVSAILVCLACLAHGRWIKCSALEAKPSILAILVSIFLDFERLSSYKSRC